MHRTRQRGARTRAALGWGLVFFAGIQLAATAFVEVCHSELYDPEYAHRLTLLRAQMARDPGRPLLLLVGSSRTVVSFCPEMLPPLPTTSSGKQPLVFNFSHLGAGPLMNRMQVERLLREGVRPDWLVVEVLPPKLFCEGHQFLIDTCVGVNDLPVLQRYLSPWKLYSLYFRDRLVRNRFRHTVLPGQTPPMERLGGYAALKTNLDRDEQDRCLAGCREQWSWVSGETHVSAGAERATRDLLDLCRREGIGVVLLLTPEGGAFRSVYSPQGRVSIEQFCERVSREYDVPVIDARDWLPDSAFSDSHHVLLEGARAFTQRLGCEVLQPLLEGNLRGPTRPTPLP